MLGITKLTSLAIRKVAGVIQDLIGTVWKTRTSGNQFNQIRVLNNQFVAVGNNNQVAYSSDGVNWNFSNIPRVSTSVVNWNINTITYGNGVYVVGCANGRIFTSTNLITWTERTSGTTGQIFDIWFYNGTFVAVGASTYIRYSTDNGVTWTAWATGVTAGTIIRVREIGGVWVIARAAASPNVAYSSTPGGSWSETTVKSGFGNANALELVNGKLYCGGVSGGMGYTINGATWYDAGMPGSPGQINHIVGDGGSTVVTIGNTGQIHSQTAADTTTFTLRTTGLTDNGFSIAYGNGRFVAAFNLGNIRYSTDGITWTNPGIYALQDTQGTTASPVATAQAWYNDKFVICTARGMFYTTNATTGTFTRAGHFTHYGAGYVKLVNGIYFGMMGNTAISSTNNGATWGVDSVFPNYIQDVEYANGLYVRCWSNGTIQTSTDGSTWTTRSSGTTFPLYSIAYDAAATYKWVIGGNGVMAYSTDGITWASTAPNATMNTIFRSSTNNEFGFVRGSTPLAANNEYPLIVSGESASVHRCVVYNSSTNTFTPRGAVSTSSATQRGKVIIYNSSSSLYITFGGTRISTSPDLDTWTVRYTGSADFTSIANGEGSDSSIVLAVGATGLSVYSLDGGLTWSVENTGTTQTFNDVIYLGSSSWLAVAGGGVTRYGPLNNANVGSWGISNPIAAVAKSPSGIVVATGNGGNIRYATTSTPYSWTASGATGTTNPIINVIWSTTYNKFIATSSIGLGSLRLHESTDGATWTNTAITILNTGFSPPTSYYTIDTTQGLLYVSPSSNAYRRIYMAKAASTTVLYDVTPYYNNNNNYNSLPPKYLNGNWYFLSGTIQSFKTSDFTTITQVNDTGNSSHFIQTGVFANNQFVVGGTDFYTSSDGETWVKRSTGYASVYGLKYRNGYYICTSTGNLRAAINYSADGITWNSTQTDPLDSARAHYFVEYINGYWYCGGSSGYLFRVPNVTSITGREKIEVGTGDALVSIAYDEANKRAIIVGSTGTLVTSNNSGT